MNNNFVSVQSDNWSEWLLNRRHGDSTKRASEIMPSIDRYADKVLDAAQLAGGLTLVDIGSGEGLIAFKAIERIGPTLQVILTDISAPILDYAKEVAQQKNVAGQCRFVLCGADDLTKIADASVDIVTTRSVLAYVSEKKKALQEFYRILKPGGRISIAEPIFRDEAFKIMAMKKWIEDHPEFPDVRLLSLINRWNYAQLPATMENISTNPLINYTERDLFTLAKESSFTDIHVELHLDSMPAFSIPWEVYIECSPHPLAPTLKEIMARDFSADDSAFLENAMRPVVESGQLEGIERMAYLSATKPLQ